MADSTLSPNSRELEDGEVADIIELAPEGHGIAQDVEDIPDANHVPSSVVDEEELPLEQARVITPPSPLPQNKGKRRARTMSEDSVIVRPRKTTSRASRRDCKGNLGRRSTLKQRTGEGGSKVNIEN
jgi:hypothetical protein